MGVKKGNKKINMDIRNMLINHLSEEKDGTIREHMLIIYSNKMYNKAFCLEDKKDLEIYKKYLREQLRLVTTQLRKIDEYEPP